MLLCTQFSLDKLTFLLLKRNKKSPHGKKKNDVEPQSWSTMMDIRETWKENNKKPPLQLPKTNKKIDISTNKKWWVKKREREEGHKIAPWRETLIRILNFKSFLCLLMVGCIHSLWIVSLTWSLNEETSLSKMLKHVTSQASLHLAFCAKCLKMLEGWVFLCKCSWTLVSKCLVVWPT